MASYQDIETRLRVLEDKVEFFMGNFRVRRMTTTGLVDEKGNPAINVEEMTLAQHYRELQNGSITKVNEESGDGTVTSTDQ